jgi:AcrR family transcriptional regulator
MTRLAELIDEHKTSIRRLARDSGVPERTVYRHVRGDTTIGLVQAAAYALALGVKIEDLLERAA